MTTSLSGRNKLSVGYIVAISVIVLLLVCLLVLFQQARTGVLGNPFGDSSSTETAERIPGEPKLTREIELMQLQTIFNDQQQVIGYHYWAKDGSEGDILHHPGYNRSEPTYVNSLPQEGGRGLLIEVYEMPIYVKGPLGIKREVARAIRYDVRDRLESQPADVIVPAP